MDGKDKRTVYLLGTTSLINDASSEAIYAILPYYVNDPTLVGVYGGLFNGLGNALKVFFGYYSDRLGKRKPLIILGYFLSALSKTLMAIVSVALLPVLILIDRPGKGIRDSPRDAILGVLKERGVAFGIHRAMDTTGALLGTLLAYFMLQWLGGDYRIAMLIAGLLGFLTLVPLAFLPSYETEKVKKNLVDSLEHMSSGVKHFLLPATLFGFAFISPMLFISGSKDELAYTSILLYALYNVFYAVFAYYLGKRSDSFGRKRVIVIGGVSAALAFALMYVAAKYASTILYALAFSFYGVGMGAFLPAAFAYVGDMAREKGTAMGAFQTVFGLAVLVSSSIFGYLLANFGSLIFLGYAVVPILAVLLV